LSEIEEFCPKIYCQTIVNKTLKVEKEEHLHNKHLKNELIKTKDIGLRKFPEMKSKDKRDSPRTN